MKLRPLASLLPLLLGVSLLHAQDPAPAAGPPAATAPADGAAKPKKTPLGKDMSKMNAAFRKMQGSSEARVGQLVGTTASLASPIPENGVGEISYVFGGSRYSAPARSEDGHAIATGKLVKITRIVGTQYFVEATN